MPTVKKKGRVFSAFFIALAPKNLHDDTESGVPEPSPVRDF